MKTIQILLGIFAITILCSGPIIYQSYAQPAPPHFEVTIFNGCNKITYHNCPQATTGASGTFLVDDHNQKHWFSTSVMTHIKQLP